MQHVAAECRPWCWGFLPRVGLDAEEDEGRWEGVVWDWVWAGMLRELTADLGRPLCLSLGWPWCLRAIPEECEKCQSPPVFEASVGRSEV